MALTIGNFDGVHRGHQAMLARLIEAADDLRLPPAVLTFDPHPREFFQRDGAPPRLTKLRQKLELFRTLGVAITFVARFDARLAKLSPAAFIDDVLVARLGVRWVLVGDDFRFGAGRAGDLATLRAHARTFSVEGMRTVVVSDERASSTAVRNALGAGDLTRAAALLGRPYAITGRVAHGDKLGRNLGFPTANIVLKHRPPLVRHLRRAGARAGQRRARRGGEPRRAPDGEAQWTAAARGVPVRLRPGHLRQAGDRRIPAQAARRGEVRRPRARSRNRFAPTWRKPANISRPCAPDRAPQKV